MVRFNGDYRIKQHAPLLKSVTVYCLEFHPCERTLQAEHLVFTYNYNVIVFIVYS